NGRHGRVGRNSRPMFWLPGQNTTIGMPTPLNGHGRIRRCVDGSLNMPPEFSAGFHAGDTRWNRSSPRLMHLTISDLGVFKDGVSELTPDDPCAKEDSVAEVGPAEVGPTEFGPAELAPPEVGPTEFGPAEVGRYQGWVIGDN